MPPATIGGINLKAIIDRFEGSYAVCENENREIFNIEKSKLPKGVKEGDCIIIDKDSITLSLNDTQDRIKRISSLMKDLSLSLLKVKNLKD